MKYPVFDFHCDTALKLMGEDLNDAGSLRRNQNHIDLERAGTLGGYCQCFACFTTTLPLEELHGVSPVLIFERELATIQRETDKNADLISIVYSPEEIEENQAQGRMSALLTIEGPAGFGFDSDLLEDLYQIGFRATTLSWNEENVLTGSNATGGGLTEEGRAYVRKAQDLGMLVDVSHISDEAFWDIMEITRAPIIASHSNSRAVCGHRRNLTDEMFLAICKTDGVAGINQYTDFLGKNSTLDTVCDHILHFLELDPSGKHICLGGDLDGCETLSQGFTGVESYNALAQRLQKRGVSENTILDIYWNNALRVLKAAQRLSR